MNDADIFIAVPVYKGAEVVGETLRSIRDQTYPKYRVLVSLDGEDAESLAVCQPFTADPRVAIVVQPERLGWAKHFNRLVNACDRPFFCYWQQDDLAASNYLETLRNAMIANPAASITYADVQWFGANFERECARSIVGSPRSRVVQAIESTHFAPLRGLMRREMIPKPALCEAGDDGSHVEFPMLAEMAGRGPLLRVEATMYFKRAHPANTFRVWNAWPPERRRRTWIRMGLGYWTVARRFFPDAEHQWPVLAMLLDRLTISRPGRAFHYQAAETEYGVDEFVREFLMAGAIDASSLSLSSGALPHFCGEIHPFVSNSLNAVLCGRPGLKVEHQLVMAQRLAWRGHLTVRINRDSAGSSMLDAGWSTPEEWGVWSDGPKASLALPIAEPGRWRVRLEAHHYASPGVSNARLEISNRSECTFHRTTMRTGEVTAIEFMLDAPAGKPVVTFAFPNAVYLPDIGLPDPRQVALGLRSVQIQRYR